MRKNKPYDFPADFKEFAMMPKFDSDIERLKPIAEKEEGEWSYKYTTSEKKYPILRNFIKYTYRRIAEQKKISITSDEKYCCWNTGLVTPIQEPIYILFEKNNLSDSQPYWHFVKFARKGERDLSKFASLPEMASYFDDPSVLFFDSRKELRVNEEHIVSENQMRFPDDLKKMNLFGLQNLLRGAIGSAIERVKRNYKTAIPQYYSGSVQLLLPLSLTDQSKADIALVVERFPDFYRATTCLTLDMAYNNARLLTRPDRDWLVP